MAQIDSLKNIDQDLLKELECPICMEYMKPPIVMCENGHSICTICKKKLRECPSCRKPFTNVRNLALESLTSIAVTANDAASSTEKGHMCPFGKISHENCTWSGRLKNMKKHIRTSHNNPNDAHVSDGNFNVVLTGISSTRHYRKAQLIHEEVFYVFWEIKDGLFYCAVLNIGSEDNASNFRYKFSLTSKNGFKNISMTFRTRSILEDLNKILKPGECVLLHYETVVEFLDPNKILSCDFEISPTEVSLGAGIYPVKNESKSQKAPDHSKAAEFPGNRTERRGFLGPNEMPQDYAFDQDFFRGRGGRMPKRSRGRWNSNRGRRGFPDMHPGGPLGLFSEGSGDLCKSKKMGWSLSDLQDETHYQQEEPNSSDKKKSPVSKGKSKLKEESRLRSQLDNMSNSELRDLIMKTLEEKLGSQSSPSSGEAKCSEATRPSTSSQKTFSSMYGLPQEDIAKLLTKSFNDKSAVKPESSSQSKKTDASQGLLASASKVSSVEGFSSDGRFNPSIEKSSVLKTDQTHFSEDENSSQKNTSKVSGGFTSAGNTSGNIYPTHLLENMSKSLGEKTPDPKNTQGALSKTTTPLISTGKSNVATSFIGNFQPGSIPKESEKKPTAPNIDTFNPGNVWICPLCNHVASKKSTINALNKLFHPQGTTWFCTLCQHWRP